MELALPQSPAAGYFRTRTVTISPSHWFRIRRGGSGRGESMRATHSFDRVRIWPKLAVASALVLLATSMVAGGVLAGNTSKQVYFGSGPTGSGVFPAGTPFGYNATTPANYSLSYTEVYSD